MKISFFEEFPVEDNIKKLNLIKTQKLGREIRIKPTIFGNSIYFQLKKIRGMIKNAN